MHTEDSPTAVAVPSEQNDKRTVIFLLPRAGRVLMEWRTYGDFEGWVYPGGKIRPGETPEDALAREFSEEMGTPLGDAQVEPLPDLDGFDGYRVWPFVVRGWHGDPPFFTDKGDRLEWINLNVATRSTLWSTTDPVVVAALERLKAENHKAGEGR